MRYAANVLGFMMLLLPVVLVFLVLARRVADYTWLWWNVYTTSAQHWRLVAIASYIGTMLILLSI